MTRLKTASLLAGIFLTAAGMTAPLHAVASDTRQVDDAVLAAREAREAANQALEEYRAQSNASPEEAEIAKKAARKALEAARKASREAADRLREYALDGIS
ncbi:hypothetical protein [Emcibacter sp.]|uniref:hypothetical protein n=1 Tax=Emcibacter sp. TaxID=1979954 RepID=UPI003A90A65C